MDDPEGHHLGTKKASLNLSQLTVQKFWYDGVHSGFS
jgi:hypothetical protein